MTNPTTIERLRAALRPLAAIADAWEANELDEDRPEWRANGVGGSPPFAEVELFTGRGGRRLLTLADAFAARDALAIEREPPVTSHPDGFSNPRGQGGASSLTQVKLSPTFASVRSAISAIMDEAGHKEGRDATPGEIAAALEANFEFGTCSPRDSLLSVRGTNVQIRRVTDDGPWRPTFDDWSIVADAKVAPDKRWPFVESPGQFAARLRDKISVCVNEANLLAAVRTVLIEEPPTLAPHVRSAAIAEMAEGLERMSARAAKLEAVYAALRTWPIFADGKEIDPEIVAREGLDKAAAEEALAALDAALRAFPELSDPDEPVGPDDVRRVAEKHAAMIRASVPHRPILSNQTDAVTTALLGIGKAWSAFREGSALGDSVGWGATREAAEADLRAKEETI